MSEKSFARPRCDPCETTFSSEEELSDHNESAHKKKLSSPEKERGIASHGELQLSPIHVQRDEQESEPLVCGLTSCKLHGQATATPNVERLLVVKMT